MRYLIARRPSAYFVAIPKNAAITIQNNAPGPPSAIAVATPVITNLVPYSSYDVIQNKLGIAKDNWNEHDMMEIIRNNKYYVDNCLIYREQLSVEAVAGKFIALFNKKMSDINNYR